MACQRARRETEPVAPDTGHAHRSGAKRGRLDQRGLRAGRRDGGTVLSPSGKSATIDSPQAKQVLTFMQQGIKDGSVPQSVLTYMEEESRNAFQTGKVSILRNWPYVYSLAKAAHVPFKVEPLPTFAGGKPAGVLGGYNLGISKYSKNPGAALSFINFATGPAAQAKFFITSSLPAVLTKTYSLPAVVKSQPFAPQLLKAVEQAQPRPISPVYPQISQALLVALIFRTLDALRIFDLPFVLTQGSNGTTSLSLYAYQQLTQNQLIGPGSALAILTFVIVMAVSMLYIRLAGQNLRALAEET